MKGYGRVWKKENKSRITSAMINILKNCSKKILLIFLKEIPMDSLDEKIPMLQLRNE